MRRNPWLSRSAILTVGLVLGILIHYVYVQTYWKSPPPPKFSDGLIVRFSQGTTTLEYGVVEGKVIYSAMDYSTMSYNSIVIEFKEDGSALILRSSVPSRINTTLSIEVSVYNPEEKLVATGSVSGVFYGKKVVEVPLRWVSNDRRVRVIEISYAYG